MLGAGYHIFDNVPSTLFFALVIVWIIMVWHVYRDIMRSRDLSGPGKALWALTIVVLPLVGCLAYLFARGGSMQQEAMPVAPAQHEDFEDYIRRIANSKE